MTFELFDPDGDVRIARGRLPHWYQPGVTYFITFRTCDSIPRAVAEQWGQRRDDWLRCHNIDPAQADWAQCLRRLPETQRRAFHRQFSQEFLEYLDRGHGECLLRRPELAEEVARSLRYADGQRYRMGDFVVMPNHVHLLVCLLGDTELEAQCYSWKKFTATRINRLLGRSGHFWQKESFDHLVRGPEEFERFQQYIAENPRRAGLREGQFLYYRAPVVS